MLTDVTIDEIIEFVSGLDGVFTQQAHAGDGTPEIAWGDTFFTYAPGATAPPAVQPFATVVTKDYPGDDTSRLDRPGAFRVNVAAGREAFVAHTGREPRDQPRSDAPPDDAVDVVIAHPVYGSAGWLAVVNPGPASAEVLGDLLRQAYALAKGRHDRRG